MTFTLISWIFTIFIVGRHRPSSKNPYQNELFMLIGEKIERIREFRGIKQETLAATLGISQQSVSKLEKEESIDDEKLKRVADALGVTPEVIKNFDEQKVIYNINNVSNITSTITDNTFDQNAAIIGALGQQFNPLEKIVELYERLLEIEKEKMELLRNQNQEK